MQTSTNKKVLIRISNLKQYFPIKGRNLFVKANDGITLDIYEGETLGLVGESGCGKSTLGRTLLQLYRQTDGRTMYYGRTLDDVAPKYVGKTYKQLAARIKNWHQLEAKEKELQAQADAMEDGTAKFAKLDEVATAHKKTNDELLDITNLIGGFIIADDIASVSKAYMAAYQASVNKKKIAVNEAALQLDLDDAQFALEKAEKENNHFRNPLKRIHTLLCFLLAL